jgi:hypothetical protein
MPTTTTHPTTWYGDRTDGTPAGFFTDHSNAAVQAQAFTLREAGNTYPDIVGLLGLQHWDHAQAAVRAHARRNGTAERVAFRAPARTRRTTAASWLAARTFGVELECSRGSMPRLPGDGIAANYPVTAATNHLVALGLNASASAYTHAVVSHWKVTYDSTVTGVEAVSPILAGDDGYRQVRLAAQGLREAGANPGGGVHVHHGVTDFTRPQLINLVSVLEAAQRALASYMPGSRQRSSWCRPMSSGQFTAIRDAISQGRLGIRSGGSPISRYSAFNFQSLPRYGTVEFRHHGATLNGSKLVTWIKLGQAVIEFARLGNSLPATVNAQELADTLVAAGLLDERTARAYLARVQQLHGSVTVVA